MPSLVLAGDTLSVRLQSKHLVVERRAGIEGLPASEMRVPLHDLDRVVVTGSPYVTIPVLQKLMLKGIPVFFVTSSGRWLGSLSPDNNKNAARRVRQYELANDSAFALKITRALIYAKLRNSRRVLQRLAANRYESEDPEQISAVQQIQEMMESVLRVQSISEARGYEGLGATLYFSRLRRFFPEDMPFPERNRRPPRDPANALLSWSYAILGGEIEGAVRSHGLDACLGFLHGIEHGRPSLALDILEPFRAPVCDLLVLNIFNHRVLTAEHFQHNPENGGIYLRQNAYKNFFYAYENSMTRKFSLTKNAAHTDFRQEIRNSILTILRLFDDQDSSDLTFFHMP